METTHCSEFNVVKIKHKLTLQMVKARTLRRRTNLINLWINNLNRTRLLLSTTSNLDFALMQFKDKLDGLFRQTFCALQYSQKYCQDWFGRNKRSDTFESTEI